MRNTLERIWYGDRSGGVWLAPLSALFAAIVALRRCWFRHIGAARLAVGRPVVVVGNLTVGGSGKTPTLVWLANALAARGLRIGVVSRGYGGSESGPTDVSATSNPARVGDEPVLLARRTTARVVVGRDRVAAARRLAPDVDLILSDDGLQHYRLARDLEIVVVDGRRGFGNGRLLPRGPLREPLSRLAEADAVLINGEGEPGVAGIRSRLEPVELVPLVGGTRYPLEDFSGRQVHAVAGIGDPERFFRLLESRGLRVTRHPLADHAVLTEQDVDFADGYPVLMTEKDAVKCGAFARPGQYYLAVDAVPDPVSAAPLLDRLESLALSARSKTL